MKIPEGLNVIENLVCKINKALSGLKQASYCWNKKFNEFAKKHNLKRSSYDANHYIKTSENKITYLLLYVDDIIIAGNDENEISNLKESLANTFEMQDMDNLKQFLGINVRRTENAIFLHQKPYLKKILEKFQMSDCKETRYPMDAVINFDIEHEPVTTKPIRELIGCLRYVMLGTRPDLSAAVNFCSRRQVKVVKPTERLWQILKRILRYIKGTIDYELVYKQENEATLIGFADADWAGDVSDRKPISGFLFQVFGNTVCWNTKKQTTVAISSTEAEYVALAEAQWRN